MIQIIDLYKNFGTNMVLQGVNLEIKHGETLAIIGRSGSGKSTLLHLIGGIDSPTSGSIVVRDRHIEHSTEEELSGFRNKHIGFIFQFHNLLSEFTVIENVMMPYLIGDFHLDMAYSRGIELLRHMEIEDKRDMKPNRLSGGESQRVAIARALVNNPSILLADEPTGNLDSATSAEIMTLLDALHDQGNTIILVTHEADIAKHAQRKIRLLDGQIASDEVSE